jgi:putative transposase
LASDPLVERPIINRNYQRYAITDAATFASKNLYNAANYLTRQTSVSQGRYLNYFAALKEMQSHEVYKALPAKIAQ